MITPIIIAFINKRTIRFSSADDIIKLREYKESKKKEKRQKKLHSKLYRVCFQKQKKYKGWLLWDFQEFGEDKYRWFRVKNKDGEHITLRFPEGMTVRRYGFSTNDRLDQGYYSYIPNLFEKLFFYLKQKYITYLMNKNLPHLISLLEDKKKNGENIDINEIYRKFRNIKHYIIEGMLLNLKNIKQRSDLINQIVITPLGKNDSIPYFSNDVSKII